MQGKPHDAINVSRRAARLRYRVARAGKSAGAAATRRGPAPGPQFDGRWRDAQVGARRLAHPLLVEPRRRSDDHLADGRVPDARARRAGRTGAFHRLAGGALLTRRRVALLGLDQGWRSGDLDLVY